MINFIKHFIILILSICLIDPGFAQTAGLLFITPQQFFDNNGNPLSGGKIYYYVPNTLTFKTVWADANETTPLTNPVTLDAAGRPNGAVAIYGQGTYRQIIRKANNDLIADLVTSSTGSGGGGGGGGATGDGDLVGTIKPWGGLIAPNQYAFAYGQELSRTTFATLFTAITQTTNVTCTSGSPILTNVSDTTQIRIGSPIELSCVAAGTTVLSKTTLTVTLSANSSLSTGTTATFFPFGNGNGSTTFNLMDLRGYTIAGRNNMGDTASARLTITYFGANPDALGAAGGSQSHTLTIPELAAHTHPSSSVNDPGHTHVVNDPGHLHTISPTAAQVSGSYTGGATPNAAVGGAAATAAAVTGIANAAAVTGITLSTNTGSNGSATPFSIVQPSLTLNYIVKITPDSASASSSGVSSINSMIGDIACGSGLLCTGNIISISGGGIGSPGGPNNSIQFNNSGVFLGSANLVWADPKLSIGAVGTTGQFAINGTTSGSVIQTVRSAAGTPTVTWGTSTGTPAVTASAPLSINTTTGNIVITGVAGQILAGATPAFTATPTLGASGTLGSITFGNATSGLATLQTVTGALGTITLSLPAATDTLVGKATTDTFTNKTYDTAGAGNSFLINGLAATANTGTGSVVRATSPTLVTPVLGVATATTVNKVIITQPATGSTITVADGKTFTASNTIVFNGTDSTTFTFPSLSGTVVTTDAIATLTGKTLSTPTINGGTHTAITSLGIRSTGTGAFDLTLNNTENLTADRVLRLTVNNASRIINISGDITTAANFTTAGSGALTLTTGGATNVTLPATGTLATIDTSQTFSGTNIFSGLTQFTDIKLSSGRIYPTADGTTALRITKADGTTRIMNFDTTNARVGINKDAGVFDLDVNDAVNIGGVLTFGTLSPTSLGASTTTITGLALNNSPNSANDYFLYYSNADGAIRKCTVGSCTAAGVAGVSSLNGLTGGLSVTSAGPLITVASGVTVALTALDSFGIVNCSLATSVGSNLLTVSLKDTAGNDPTSTSPCKISFRNSTSTTGSYSINTITAALSINTNATGATLGSVNNTAFRFWVIAFDNSGTTVLALYNASTFTVNSAAQICSPNENLIASTTAISGSATSACVFYTPNGTTLTNKAFRIIGFIEYDSTGLATAGTYASAPDFIQTISPGIKLPGDQIACKMVAGVAGTTTTSSTFTTTNVSVVVTPSSASNFIKVNAYASNYVTTNINSAYLRLQRGATAISTAVRLYTTSGSESLAPYAQNIFDKPNSISATTYAVYMSSSNNTNLVGILDSGSGITACEIMG